MSFGDPWFYIVLLGAAALVYALLLPGRKATQPSSPGSASELEATLEQFMSEIEKENEELIDLIAGMKQDFAAKQLAQQEQLVELRKRLVEVEQNALQYKARLDALDQQLSAAPSRPAETASEPKSETTAADLPAARTPEIAVVQAEPAAAVETMPEEAARTESVRDRYPELFHLYEQGKSMDMIAKSVGIQRGEVQLILQLAKREESR
ncbi:hypothetical protein J25TS5_07470 [Paenibacillus faecis]|uniref:hypothetical protein n=1 Tax=Paenibacillus faecis TaxID=862114 RepID=UPI001B098F40|nr:hypothetical protein [Paenibacillus faecis]GIO83815.1 hypothetical protein J25TS5_07470 [Paenibacillus faecis]